MNWKTILQVSVAAAVGATLFEAGRLTAMRDYVCADAEIADVSSDAVSGDRIAEPKSLPGKSVVQKRAADAPGPAVTAEKPSFKRKKYADLPLAPQDREIVSATELIVNNEDINAALTLAPKAAKASRKEVRMAAVEMLAWFGKKTIAELTQFLGDADEGVAMEASAQWKRIYANECDDAERLKMAALVLNKLTSETMLEELKLEDVFNEIEDEAAAVEALIAVIRNGNPAGVKFAKDAYDTVTGEKWTDESAARKWIRENASEAG